VLAVTVGRHEITAADNAQFLVGLRISFIIMAVLSAVCVVTSLIRGDVQRHGKAAESVAAVTEA
jgi:hypothetical protein